MNTTHQLIPPDPNTLRPALARSPERLVMHACAIAGRAISLGSAARSVVAANLRQIHDTERCLSQTQAARISENRRPAQARVQAGRTSSNGSSRRVTASDIYASYGRYWAELLLPARPGGATDTEQFAVQGIEHLEAAEKSGAVCALTGHLGNWDLAARWFAQRLPGFAVLAEELANRRLFDAFVRLRERHGMRVIHGSSSGTALYRHLCRGGHAGLVADRAFGHGVEAIPFLGGRRLFPSSGMRIARRAGASLLPVFLVRAADRFCLRIHPAIEPGHDPVAGFAGVLEREILAFPEQWCVLYPLHDAVEGQ